MYDQFGRLISYMRISVTDRCNMNCIYCRPQGIQYIKHRDILTYEEILRICGLATRLGIDSFKVTGGEPLVRKGCLDFLEKFKHLPGVANVTLTTNGSMLAPAAQALSAIGVDGVNISLDTCNATRFQEITGVDGYKTTLQGIEAGLKAGLKMKLNCVPLKTTQEQEFVDLLRLAEKYGLPLRFIELMPLQCNGSLDSYSGREIRELLSKCLKAEIIPKTASTGLGNGPAVYYTLEGFKIPLGFIEPIHGKFCGSCNRIRLTSTGGLKTCLHQAPILDVRSLLRTGCNDKEILEAMEKAVYYKPREHSFNERAGKFSMNEIGG